MTLVKHGSVCGIVKSKTVNKFIPIFAMEGSNLLYVIQE